MVRTAEAAEMQKQLQALTQVWVESKQRSVETKQAEQERGDAASVAAAEEAKVAASAAEAELVRMLLEVKEQGADVELVLQQHEGLRAVFEKACAENITATTSSKTVPATRTRRRRAPAGPSQRQVSHAPPF